MHVVRPHFALIALAFLTACGDAERKRAPRGDVAAQGATGEGSSTTSFEVHLFRPEDGRPVPDVEVSAGGLALSTSEQHPKARTSADGIARFPSVPTSIEKLWIRELGADGGDYLAMLVRSEWRLAGEARVLATPKTPARQVGVRGPVVPSDAPWPRIQVVPEGGSSYAIVYPSAGHIEDDGWVYDNFWLATGVSYRIYSAWGKRGGFVEIPAAPRSDDDSDASIPIQYEALSTLRLNIARSPAEQHVVRVRCHRKEGAKEVLAQGWSVLASTAGFVEVLLPIGEYRVSVLDGSREGPSVVWTFKRPDSQAELSLGLP